MVPDSSKTCLGMEYFSNIGDSLWSKSDEELIELATKELETLGLAKGAIVEDGTVIRQPKAYPVYDRDYRQHLDVIQDYLQKFELSFEVQKVASPLKDATVTTAYIGAPNMTNTKCLTCQSRNI